MKSGERLHHLDALRALTMLLILPAHALALIGLSDGWNDLEAAIFWTIHVFRLPLFFLVAGFFGALLVRTQGVRTLAQNRVVRIGIPLLFGVAVVVPGLTLELQSIASQPHRSDASGFGAFVDFHPSYLWFLWYLTLFYIGALLLRRVLTGLPRLRCTLTTICSRLMPLSAAPLLLAVPCAMLLYRQPTWLADAPAESFLPRFDLLGYYAIFFASGWMLFVGPGL
jgi:fucose 4-O-acetylase-like acetyltransferase